MNKILSTTISITQLLANENCTYNEADKIIETLQDWIKQSRQDNEYDIVTDFIRGKKTKCVDDDVVKPLNHAEPYC